MGVSARLVGAVAFGPVELQPGNLHIRFRFRGGREPAIEEATVMAVVHGESCTLEASGDGVRLDGRLLSAEPMALAAAIESLAAVAHDPDVRARAMPRGEVVVRFVHGVSFTIPERHTITVHGAAEGPPDQLKLARSLVFSVEGAGIRLEHRQMRWLASLAGIRVTRAMLHPDGSIDLHGGARPGLERAVRGGLLQASAGLSRLVRNSPDYHRVRAFLNHPRKN